MMRADSEHVGVPLKPGLGVGNAQRQAGGPGAIQAANWAEDFASLAAVAN